MDLMILVVTPLRCSAYRSHSQEVVQGNELRYCNDQGDFGLKRLLDSLRSLVCSNVHACSIWFEVLHGLKLRCVNKVSTTALVDLDYVLTARIEGSTGSPRCSPSLPGVTPPTIWVPHSKDCFAFCVAYVAKS